MKKILTIHFYLLFSLGSMAQGETDWWYFGDHAGIHFSEDTVEAVFNSAMDTDGRGNTSMSDSFGNLLYYSNGNAVYDSSHNFMLNGEDLGANPNGTAATSVKILNDENKYFLINFQAGGVGFNYAGYAFIDMEANGGLGAVQEHQLLPDTLLMFVTTTRQLNGIDYWVVFREPNGNKYITYSLTSSGLDASNPIYSYAGDPFIIYSTSQQGGTIRINPAGNLLAFTHERTVIDNIPISEGKLELFHFDNSTGMVGERIVKLDETNAPFLQVPNDSTFSGFGTEFSLDGEKLYYSDSFLFQCNISILDSASIVQSIIRLYDVYIEPFDLTGLQLAKDGRLYITGGGASALSVIHHPNIAGFDCAFELAALSLVPNSTGYNLPNFDPSFFSSGFTVANRCLFDETEFELIYDMPYNYVFWEFGDGNTSLEWEPTHSYQNTGIYIVTLTTAIELDTTVKTMEVIIEEAPSVDLGIDSSLFCEGDTLLLDAYFYASYYTWQDSSYQSTFEVTNEGKYFVEVRNICGVASDTVSYVLDRDNVTLGNDTIICLQEPLLLLANQPSATDWLWQDGSTLPFYEAESTGEYFVFVTTPCLFIYDSISVETQDCALYPPNIITPNGDGINDYFTIPNLYQLNYNWSLEVYNRWGQQVFYNAFYQNDWKADNLSDGVYFYILRSSTSVDFYKGSVTVLRGK